MTTSVPEKVQLLPNRIPTTTLEASEDREQQKLWDAVQELQIKFNTVLTILQELSP